MRKRATITVVLLLLLGLIRGCETLPSLPLDPTLEFIVNLLSRPSAEVSQDQEADQSEEEPDLVLQPTSRPRTASTRTENPTTTPLASTAYLDLPVPVGLEPRVRLWEAVYGECDSNQVVLFHREYPAIIYEIVPDQPRLRERAMERIRYRLYTLHTISRDSEDPETEILSRPNGRELLALYHQFEKVPGEDKFLVAQEAIGLRRGRRDELIRAYARALPYLPAMERIFQGYGLPVGLTRLVFVESMFRREAVSNKNAVGVWQFLPTTASRYLVMSSALDERRDPIASTRAAARFLKQNYQSFHSWPLAVTAYNAGPGLVLSAMRATGSRHLASLLERSEHQDIGFAVENYYAQLLGVIRAEKKLKLYLHNKKPNLNPLDYDLVPLPAAYDLSTLAHRLGMNKSLLIALNPAWTNAVETDQTPIPKNYLLRVPKGSESIVRAALSLSPQVADVEY